jgi:two-component system OmpR family sensor kinase
LRSIQANLVLRVLVGLAFGVTVVLAATYAFAYLEISRVFDAELRSIAHAVHLREDWIEAGRVRIARPGFEFSVRAYDEAGHVYFETALPTLPQEVPQMFGAGYRDIPTAEGDWRVYTHVTPEGIVQVAQPDATREELARELSLRMAAPVFLLVPLLVGVAAWALGRGLAPLKQISRRVSDRDATRLDALPTDDVPRELLPLIEQINALLARLEASLETQRCFIADAAHELRSPVAALALQAQLAERAQPEAARTAAFAELERGIARAARLVEQLLDLARLERGSREPMRPLDLAQLARETVGAYAARADALGVDLGADAPRPARVLGAEAELRSLLSNLVDNALRYAPRASEVTVAVQSSPSAVELRVLDRGPGIPPPERARVFERFERVNGDPTPGSGLGLPIARAIVAHHRGTIALADAVPGGSPPGLAVSVTLPPPA